MCSLRYDVSYKRGIKAEQTLSPTWHQGQRERTAHLSFMAHSCASLGSSLVMESLNVRTKEQPTPHLFHWFASFTWQTSSILTLHILYHKCLCLTSTAFPKEDKMTKANWPGEGSRDTPPPPTQPPRARLSWIFHLCFRSSTDHFLLHLFSFVALFLVYFLTFVCHWKYWE